MRVQYILNSLFLTPAVIAQNSLQNKEQWPLLQIERPTLKDAYSRNGSIMLGYTEHESVHEKIATIPLNTRVLSGMQTKS